MFTIDDIKQAHAKVKSGADFPQYIRELKTLGIIKYDNFVTDGKTNYYGLENYSLTGPAKYPPLSIHSSGNSEQLTQSLAIHQAGKTDYPTFCKQAADAGVAKWTVHLVTMTCTYFDKSGNVMVVEDIPS